MEDIANMIDRNIGKGNFSITVVLAYFVYPYFVRGGLFLQLWISEITK